MVDTRWSSFYFSDLINNDILLIGDGYRAKNNELGGTGPIFLRSQHVKDSCIDLSGVDRFHAELADVVASKMSKVGDVIITTKGNSTGRVSYASLDLPVFVYSPHLSFWRSLKPDILHPDYLRYWSRGKDFQQQLCGLSCSTDMAPYLSLTDQRRLKIALPPIEEQRAIARILGSLDDKIELNRRMSETMEAMARAIFKSWFVDFDPVRAKSEGREPAGMDAETTALFPDSFEETELGMVPKGWEIVSLPKIIDVNPPRSLRKSAVASYLDMANMPSQGHVPEAVTLRPFGSGMRFINGDTLVARITPCLENGKTAYVDFLKSGEVGWGSTEYIVLRPKPPLPTEFAYCLARSQEFRVFAIQSMTGTSGRQRVPAQALSHYSIVSPPPMISEHFGHLVSPIFARARKAMIESRTLAALRDTLLPRFISGKIRVEDAEEFLKVRNS